MNDCTIFFLIISWNNENQKLKTNNAVMKLKLILHCRATLFPHNLI